MGSFSSKFSSKGKLTRGLDGLSAASFPDEAERIQVRDALFIALRRVQTPWDIAWEQIWAHGATYACVKTLIDAGVFKRWVESGGGAKTSAELAALAGVEEQLVRRMIRHLAGQILVNEVAEDTFTPTPWVNAVADPNPPLASVYGKFYSHLKGPVFGNMPLHLRETGYRDPVDAADCNLQHWRKSKDSFFQFLGSDPDLLSDFHDAMQCHSRFNHTSWTKVYPTKTIIAKAKPGRPLVVDVGGSKGHDLEKFRAAHPRIPDGSLILQDLPDVVKVAKVDKAISPSAYDFFTPQPVHGAKVYFLHNILHDWDDSKAVSILRNVAGGMEKGYSKLLIYESVVSSVRPQMRVTTSDLNMMSVLAARERSESEWRQLVRDAGLKVVRIWRPAQSVESMIETELA